MFSLLTFHFLHLMALTESCWKGLFCEIRDNCAFVVELHYFSKLSILYIYLYIHGPQILTDMVTMQFYHCALCCFSLRLFI